MCDSVQSRLTVKYVVCDNRLVTMMVLCICVQRITWFSNPDDIYMCIVRQKPKVRKYYYD